MEYCILNAENVIENIIVAEADFAESIGAVLSYDGAAIGSKYDPPEEPVEETLEERVETLESENNLLSQQIQATDSRSDFLEECIVEMAEIIYAE